MDMVTDDMWISLWKSYNAKPVMHDGGKSSSEYNIFLPLFLCKKLRELISSLSFPDLLEPICHSLNSSYAIIIFVKTLVFHRPQSMFF